MINDPSWCQIGSWIKQISFSFYFLLPTVISSKKIIIYLKDYKTGNWLKKKFPYETGNWLNLTFPHWELVENFNPIFGNWFQKKIPLVGIGWLFSFPKMGKWDCCNKPWHLDRYTVTDMCVDLACCLDTLEQDTTCHTKMW